MRYILLTVIFTIAVFSVVTYTACKKDPCKDVICLHLGACDGGECICPIGYEGDRCEELTRDRFVRTYTGGDTCTARGYHQYPIQLLARLSNPRELTMKNVLGDPNDSAICTIRSLDSFTFIGTNNATTYRGWGRLGNDSLTMEYHVEQGINSYDCSYLGLGLR